MTPHGCVFCTLPQWQTHPDDIDVLNIEPLGPVVPGHRLFIPRQHVERADSDPDVTGAVFAEAARWGAGQGGDFNLIVNAGRAATQSVDHLHVHYVPRVGGDGLTLPWTGQHDAALPSEPAVTVDRDDLSWLIGDFLNDRGLHGAFAPRDLADALIAASWSDAAREELARAIETTPWEQVSSRGPGTDDVDGQRRWMHGANAGVEFAARIVRTHQTRVDG